MNVGDYKHQTHIVGIDQYPHTKHLSRSLVVFKKQTTHASSLNQDDGIGIGLNNEFVPIDNMSRTTYILKKKVQSLQ